MSLQLSALRNDFILTDPATRRGRPCPAPCRTQILITNQKAATVPAPSSYNTETQSEKDDLAKLATALAPLGCKTVLVTSEDRPPSLDVINPDAGSERIRAQADFFWWPTARVIAFRHQPATAAQIIARTLAAFGPAPAR